MQNSEVITTKLTALILQSILSYVCIQAHPHIISMLLGVYLGLAATVLKKELYSSGGLKD